MRQNIAGLVLGMLLGLLVTSTPIFAQTSSINITQSGQWQAQIQCDVQSTITTSLDGAAVVPYTATWTGTGPYTVMVDYPLTTAARTKGPHTYVIALTGQTVTMADGTTVTYGTGTFTVNVKVYPDTSSSPAIIKWIRVAGTVALNTLKGAVKWLG